MAKSAKTAIKSKDQKAAADAKNWGVFADVRYADLSPEVTLDDATAAAVGKSKFNLDIDPWVYTIGYSYKF